VSQESPVIKSPFTLESFAPLVGDEFLVVFSDLTLPMTLIKAEATPLKPYDGRAVGKSGFVRTDPFQLLFRGPEDKQLIQALYTFRHKTLGDFGMSIVPMGPGETGMVYEAVFN